MSDHYNCPSLKRCQDHPKWKVTKGITRWWVISPGYIVRTFRTHAEAINHAHQQARKDTR